MNSPPDENPVVVQSTRSTLVILGICGAFLVLSFAGIAIGALMDSDLPAAWFSIASAVASLALSGWGLAHWAIARTTLDVNGVSKKTLTQSRRISRTDISGFRMDAMAVTLIHGRDIRSSLRITPEAVLDPRFRAWLNTLHDFDTEDANRWRRNKTQNSIALRGEH